MPTYEQIVVLKVRYEDDGEVQEGEEMAIPSEWDWNISLGEDETAEVIASGDLLEIVDDEEEAPPTLPVTRDQARRALRALGHDDSQIDLVIGGAILP